MLMIAYVTSGCEVLSMHVMVQVRSPNEGISFTAPSTSLEQVRAAHLLWEHPQINTFKCQDIDAWL